ncbi:MAG: C40 family peptidase [Bacteroidales bacterium]|nr:C40 family peptidase [Bacteroidales bacterium]
MNKHRIIHVVALTGALLLSSTTMTSCKFIKNILNTQLEDEDYIVGQLYADELVKETPMRFERPANTGSGSTTQATSGFGMQLNDKDNRKLYAAIDKWYGTPYQYGGCSTSGVDCSCFVGNIFKTVYGVTLKRSANDIQQDMDKFITRNNLREGDIVFFTNSNGKVSHVGIYLKDDLFVHSSTSNGVSISSLENSYWKKHFYRGGRHKSVTTQYK